MSARSLEIYHYKSIGHLGSIVENGLMAELCESVLRYPAGPTLRGLYGLLKAEPEGWTNNDYFPEEWTRLESQTGSLLLKLTLTEQQVQDSLVLDWAYMAGYMSRNHRRWCYPWPPEKYAIDILGKATQAYLRSAVGLDQYMSGGDYMMPEVFMPFDIGLDQIEIPQHQPRNPEVPYAIHREIRENWSKSWPEVLKLV